MRYLLLIALLVTCPAPATASGGTDSLVETHRIRIVNSVDGPVQVSADSGDSYLTVGRVSRPATSCVQGFAASIYARDGCVAAVAVHAIRVRARSMRGRDGAIPQVFSVIPKEFAKPGGDFGTVEIAGASGIYTDIPAGTAIFRNLAPYVGNPAFLEKGRRLRPLPENYTPSPGDVIVITAQIQRRRPREITFDNRRGGSVEAVYTDSREKIAIVERPVRGVGRFDATEYTGVGLVNTIHTGVITVSTAAVSAGRPNRGEPRGGFQILPSRHAARIGWIPQYMVIAPLTHNSNALEGSPPLFSGHIGLAYDPSSEEGSFVFDVRTDRDERWRPLSELLGKRDDALAHYLGRGISQIRLRFPRYSDGWAGKELIRSANAYVKARYGDKPASQGVLSFAMSTGDLTNVSFVSLFVDGTFRGMRSTAPFVFTVDTRKLPPGEHCVEMRASSGAGAVLKSAREWFYTLSDQSAGAG